MSIRAKTWTEKKVMTRKFNCVDVITKFYDRVSLQNTHFILQFMHASYVHHSAVYHDTAAYITKRRYWLQKY